MGVRASNSPPRRRGRGAKPNHALSEEVKRLGDWLKTGKSKAAAANPHARAEAFEELSAAYEELRVADEQLRQTNDALMTASSELEAEKRRYEDLFHAAPDGYLVTNSVGVILEANRAACELLALPLRLLTGKPLVSFFTASDRKKLAAGILDLRKTHREAFELTVRPRRGEPFASDLNSAAILDGAGRVTGLRWMLRNITEQKRAEKTLLDYQARLRSLAAELLRVEERERRRLAENLHDDIGQTLVLARMKLGALRQSLNDQAGAEAVDEVSSLVAQAVARTRTLTFELSPPVLYDLGLDAALEWLAEHLREQYKLSVKLFADAAPVEVELETRVLLFQCARELLLNVAKHSSSSEAVLSLRRVDEKLHLTVQDRGVGFAWTDVSPGKLTGGGFGLFSIRTRLEHLGGSLQIESAARQGCRVTLIVPIPNTPPRQYE